MPKNINSSLPLVVICGQSFFPKPVSGGDVLNFDFLRNVSGFTTHLIINDITVPYARKMLNCNILPISDFLNLNALIQKYLFLVPLGFANSTFKIWNILRKSFNESLILYSSGDFICNIFPMVLYKKRFPTTKIIVRVHHINENPLVRKGNFFAASVLSYVFQRISFRLLKQSADLILLLNNDIKKALLKIGFSKDRLEVIGAGVDLNKIPQNSIKLRKNQIVFFARLSKTKGVFDLPNIFKEVADKIPDSKLILIGMVTEKTANSLYEEFQKLNLKDRVEIKGFIEKNDVYKIMSESKIFILPSYEEGWGLTVFEAIACGLAPVVYNLPVFKEIFGKSIQGVSVGNTSFFAKTIVKFFSNEKLRKEYVLGLNKKIKRYDWNEVAEKELGLIKRLQADNFIFKAGGGRL